MSDIEIRTYVDEDWKARVQREKEEARLKAQGTERPSAEADAAAPPRQQAETAPAPDDAGITPAFETLVSSLATQTMYCLGFIAAPGQGQAVVNLDQAKESVDMLLMLRDKTQGNLSAQESAVLLETLSELQRLFAARVQQMQAQTMQQAGIDPRTLHGAPPQ